MSDDGPETLSFAARWTSDRDSKDAPRVGMTIDTDGEATYFIGAITVTREVYLDALATVRADVFAELRDTFASMSSERIGYMLDRLASKVLDDE